MKKQFTHLALLVFSSFSFLASCNKADVKDQLSTTPATTTTSARSLAEQKCGCHCPSDVAEATSISYSLSTWSPVITVAADVFYTNTDADGTFRVVLRNAADEIVAINIVNAPVTQPGETGTFSLSYSVPPDEFPCSLHVNGRPTNLDCDVRSHKVFTIESGVSKH